MSSDEYIATVEVAEILRIDRSTVLRWVEQGKLTSARQLPGRTGSLLFRRSDIEAMRPAEPEAVAS